jgi:Peptidase A4 family/Putative Ig domain
MRRRTVIGTALAILAGGVAAGFSAQLATVSAGDAPAANSIAPAEVEGQEYGLLRLAGRRTSAPSLGLTASPAPVWPVFAAAPTLGLAASPALAIGPVWTTSVAAPRPVIHLISASPGLIPGRGGTVLVRVKVDHALRCAFRGQRRAFGALVLRQTVNCAGGRASVYMPVTANSAGHGVLLRFEVTATDAQSRSTKRGIDVVQLPQNGPKDQPLAIATTSLPAATVGAPYSATLTASGGAAPYIWSVVSGSLPPGIGLSAAGVLAGTPTAAGAFTFGVSVSDSKGRNKQAGLALSVAAPQVPTATSTNWSGYVLSGATYTGVGGTFNVPTIFSSPTDTATAEWVGIDGASASNPTILQLGVAEDYSLATNRYSVFAWFELFPQPPSLVPLAVTPGDRVTVGMSQAGAGVWTVSMKNETTGQGVAANVSYAGPGLSAEWVVEAPFDVRTSTVIPVGNFSPVTFSQLGIAPYPAQGSLTRVVMVQNGQAVATPSAPSANGFTVAHGSATPTPP